MKNSHPSSACLFGPQGTQGFGAGRGGLWMSFLHPTSPGLPFLSSWGSLPRAWEREIEFLHRSHYTGLMT